jgi:methylglutaconyl-CoA hydratase
MSLVNYKVNDRIGYIVLNRPEKRNALSQELIAELHNALLTAESDDRAKVIVLAASGDAFCAGADLAYLQKLQSFSFEENLADSQQLKNLFLKIYHFSKIVIAQVNGAALAGGCGLVSVCDFALASASARFGYTEVRIGFIPALVTVFLLRKIGEQKARQLLLSGELVSAQQALDLGMITRVVQPGDLEGAVKEFAQMFVSNNSAQAMKQTKQLIADVQGIDLNAALELAAASNARARATEDCKRGIAAFLNKEKLSW